MEKKEVTWRKWGRMCVEEREATWDFASPFISPPVFFNEELALHRQTLASREEPTKTNGPGFVIITVFVLVSFCARPCPWAFLGPFLGLSLSLDLSWAFLDASSHLYKRVCPAIGRSVGWVVGWSVGRLVGP